MSKLNHFYMRNKSGKPVGCVSWVRVGSAVSFATSVCAKQDTFTKEMGRTISAARLINGKSHTIKQGGENNWQIMRSIMLHMATHRNNAVFPQQAIDSARLWLDKRANSDLLK